MDEVKPLYISDAVDFDTDDPAIWVNPIDSSKSLVNGTDKDAKGGLYVFDLKGKSIPEKTIKNLNRPNNVDIAYNLIINRNKVDIAVTTERYTHKLRIFALPTMKPLDNGGIPVFEGEKGTESRDLMGISLYTDSANALLIFLQSSLFLSIINEFSKDSKLFIMLKLFLLNNFKHNILL